MQKFLPVCTRDGAATTWSFFAMFQINVIVVVGWNELRTKKKMQWFFPLENGQRAHIWV
jgi:hypothetical protein